MTDGLDPGEVLPAEGTVTLNEGRETTDVTVRNTGDRPVQVGSHFHFFEVNAALAFDRAAAFGSRLNVPAGTAVRFEPGETQTVELVALGGKRRVEGANGLTSGSVDGGREAALERARAAGFADDGANAAESGDGATDASGAGEPPTDDATGGDEPAESDGEDEEA